MKVTVEAGQEGLRLPDARRLASDDERLTRARQRQDAASRAVAVAAQRLAASLIARLLPTAATVVFNVESDYDGPEVGLVCVRDGSGGLLWYDECTFGEHPDAVGLANIEAYGGAPRIVLHRETSDTIIGLIGEAYDAYGGLFDGSTETVPGPGHRNLLELDVVDALTLAEPVLVQLGAEEAVRAWLADTPDIDEDWAPSAAAVADLVQVISDDRSVETALVWAIHRSVELVFTSQLADGAVIVGADLTDGGRITTIPQDDRDLRDSQGRTGVGAAVEALRRVANLLNEAYRRR